MFRTATAEELRSPTLLGLMGFRLVGAGRGYPDRAVCLAAILRYFGFKHNCANVDMALGSLPQSSYGFYHPWIYAKRIGFATALRRGSPAAVLAEFASQGKPVMVQEHLHSQRWRVCAGFDPNRGQLLLADPQAPSEERWQAVTLDDYDSALLGDTTVILRISPYKGSDGPRLRPAPNWLPHRSVCHLWHCLPDSKIQRHRETMAEKRGRGDAA